MDKIITVKVDPDGKIYLVMNDSTIIHIDRDKKTLQQNFMFDVRYNNPSTNHPGKLTYDQFIKWVNDQIDDVDNINDVYFIRLIKK